MSQKAPKKEKLRGFASVIANALGVAQKINKEKVDELIKGKRTKVLFNPKDGKWAALITIDKGEIEVKGIKNTPKKSLKRKNLLWWGYLEAPMKYYLNAGNTSSFQWFLRMITWRTKLRGIPHLRFIGEITKLAGKN
jgi:hypothetical protein